ncbi:hypothetical protein OAI24_03465 [Alphaproteobacteria bacterium]|nr:hypothetical protein [Alphaproteobacteria bacterium]
MDGFGNVKNGFASQEILEEVYQDPYARSHPMSRDRVNAYVEGASKSKYGDQKDDPALVFRHQMAKAKLYGFIDKPEVTLRRYKGDTSPSAKYARAIAYHQMANLEKSVALIDQLIEQFPDNPWFYELKGQVYYESGRAQEGLDSYIKAVSMRPDEPLLLIGLATCQIGTGIDGGEINQQAITNIRTALRLDPENISAYHQLSKAYGQLDRPAYAQWALAEYHALVRSPEAATYANRAIRGLPENSVEYLRARDILKMTF